MPAKKQFINKLREDQEVTDLFLVLLKQVSAGRTGRNYLRLTIGDRTGRIEARVWEGADELAQRFNQGDLVYVTGVVNSFQGVLQIKATYVEPLEEGAKVDWAEFLPSSERPAGEMLGELASILSTVKNPHLAALLNSFATDAAFVSGFTRAPAAAAMHHAYIAGLLEHTLGVVKLADKVAGLYPLDRDLLLAGAFLHDLGKTRELGYSAGFDYTDEGRLLGHLVLGLDMIREKVSALKGFPPELLLHLEHLMVSHHGELEWGSPKRPKTLEALALHAIDNIDAKLSAASRSLDEVDARGNGWTGYMKMFERPLVRTPEFAGEAAREKAPEAAAPALGTPEAPVEAPADEPPALTSVEPQTEEKPAEAPAQKPQRSLF